MGFRGFWVNNSKNTNGNESNHQSQHTQKGNNIRNGFVKCEMVTKNTQLEIENINIKHLMDLQLSKYTYNGCSLLILCHCTSSSKWQLLRNSKEMNKIVNTNWKSICASAFLSAFDGSHSKNDGWRRRGKKVEWKDSLNFILYIHRQLFILLFMFSILCDKFICSLCFLLIFKQKVTGLHVVNLVKLYKYLLIT